MPLPETRIRTQLSAVAVLGVLLAYCPAMEDSAPPLLLFVAGPPAVGKMSVGQAITERTGLRLFHNHLSIELALRYFDYGTPAFGRLNDEIRRRVIEEVAASDLPGLVFTFAWAFDVPEDQVFVDEYARPFRERGARVLFVELEATQAERLKRNECVSRLAEKPSKRDLEASRRRLLKPTPGTSSTPAGSSTRARTTCASTTRS